MRTLVLDIGGVFYLGALDAAFWALWGERAGLDPQALRDRFWFGPDIEAANLGRITAQDYYARAAPRLGLSPDLVRQMVEAAFLGEINHAFADHVRALRRRGVPVSALSNSWSSQAELMARPELAGLFDLVVSSRDVGLAKPDPAIFRVTLERLGLAARDVVFVDDTLTHVEVARSLGIEALHFQDTDEIVTALEWVFPC